MEPPAGIEPATCWITKTYVSSPIFGFLSRSVTDSRA